MLRRNFVWSPDKGCDLMASNQRHFNDELAGGPSRSQNKNSHVVLTMH